MQRREFLRATGAGAGALGAAGSTAASAAAQEDGGNETDGGDGGNQTDGGDGGNQSDGGDGGAGGGGTETVTVGPDGENIFDPEDLAIAPGTTVVWEWDSPGHNVNPTSIPDDAEWEGYPDVVGPPNSHEHTFDVLGTYDYECTPHAEAGMLGTVEVTENPNEGDGGQQGPTVPASALSLGIGIFAAMSSTVALAFFFLKYGSSDDEE